MSSAKFTISAKVIALVSSALVLAGVAVGILSYQGVQAHNG